MTRLAWLAAVSCFILAACGQQSSPAPESASSTTASTTTATSAPSAAPAAAPAAARPAAPAEVVNAGEDLETVDSEAAAPAAPSPLLAAALAAAPPAAPPGKWKKNENYLELVPTQPTVTNLKGGHVEVVEVFWYACPHCYQIDPLVESWRTNHKPPYVDFVRMPAMWNAGTQLLGRMYYTVEALGKLPEMHSKIFEAAHQNQLTLIDREGDAAATGKLQADFARAFGISAADYLKEYNGFGVDQKMRRAEQLGRAYLVTGVPTFVVNGKYVTDVGHVGGDEEKVFELLNDLAAMEKAGR